MIGDFDNTSVLAAVLPACLKNGTNPAPFSTGAFPVYSNDNTYTSTGLIHLSGQYTNGTIDCTSGGVVARWATSPATRTLTTEVDVTIDVTFTLNAFSKFITFDVSEESGRFYHLFIPNAGFAAYQAYNDADEAIIVSAKNQAFQLGTKYTMTVVKSGVNQSIYINGQPLAPANYGVKTDFSGQMVTETIYVGTSNSTPSTSIIHRCIVYSRALGDAEVLSIYNLGDDLGGLLGIDAGNGVMDLIEGKVTPRTSSRVSMKVQCGVWG